MGITAQLSARISGAGFETLDGAGVATIKRLIADGVAVAIAGSREESSAIVARHLRDLECGPRSSVWGHGYKTSSAFAACANGVSMHALDFEPMSSPATHAVSPTVPVALALAETEQAHGREIIVACAKGLEMQARLLSAANHVSDAMPFHTPGVVGVLGSAVTASHLLKLDPPQLANALGIAASRAGTLRANAGSMMKDMHCGNAAAAGLDAAVLARRGFTAHSEILDADAGYVATFFPKRFDYDTLLQFGEPYRCIRPGMAIKFFPSEYPTHFAIAAALTLRRNVPDHGEIKHVHVVTPAMPELDRAQPQSGADGKRSFQYTVAVALLDGKVGIQSFTNERRFRRDVVELLDRISVVHDKDIPTVFSTMHVEVTVSMRDDRKFCCVCNKPPGFWGEPIERETHHEKVRACLSITLEKQSVDRVVELLDNLEQLSSQEVAELSTLLR